MTSSVLFIPKPEKASHVVAKAYRPISLSSFLQKTPEKLDRYAYRGQNIEKIPHKIQPTFI